MKYLDHFLKCLGIFIIGIPIVFLYGLITREILFPPSRKEFILVLIVSIIGTIGVFIIGAIEIRKKSKEDKKEKPVDKG